MSLSEFAITELMISCSCLCGTQFCYVYATLWKNCECPNADEDNLYDDEHYEDEDDQLERVHEPDANQGDRVETIDDPMADGEHAGGEPRVDIYGWYLERVRENNNVAHRDHQVEEDYIQHANDGNHAVLLELEKL